jgi:hypothetical protein
LPLLYYSIKVSKTRWPPTFSLNSKSSKGRKATTLLFGSRGFNFFYRLGVPMQGMMCSHYILAGRAFITYDALTAAEKANYALLKAALCGRLVPGDHAQIRRQEVMGMTRRLDESLPSFELRIMEAVTITYADYTWNREWGHKAAPVDPQPSSTQGHSATSITI